MATPNKKEVWKSEEAAELSFERLIKRLEDETKIILEQGSNVVPQVQFLDLQNGTLLEAAIQEIKKRGVVVIRNVVEDSVASAWAEEAENYVVKDNNYHGDASEPTQDEFFAQATPQIYGVYWNKPQIQARQHPNMQKARAFLNSLWSHQTPTGEWAFDPSKESTYADRQRVRLPGNVSGLVPHIDGGSIERWSDPGYLDFYQNVYNGHWEDHDPWNGALRIKAQEFASPNVCTVFRSFQGWLALSKQGPGDGTLQVVPLLKESTAHILLRPFLSKTESDCYCGAYLQKQHQILPEWHELLLKCLVTIPEVQPGDTVWWHPDLIHAVEKHHNGQGKSSVLYIGAAPFCEKNKAYLAKQKESFLEGQAGPDFPQEGKEVNFKNRATLDDLSGLGKAQMGFERWKLTGEETPQQLEFLNKIQ